MVCKLLIGLWSDGGVSGLHSVIECNFVYPPLEKSGNIKSYNSTPSTSSKWIYLCINFMCSSLVATIVAPRNRKFLIINLLSEKGINQRHQAKGQNRNRKKKIAVQKKNNFNLFPRKFLDVFLSNCCCCCYSPALVRLCVYVCVCCIGLSNANGDENFLPPRATTCRNGNKTAITNP